MQHFWIQTILCSITAHGEIYIFLQNHPKQEGSFNSVICFPQWRKRVLVTGVGSIQGNVFGNRKANCFLALKVEARLARSVFFSALCVTSLVAMKTKIDHIHRHNRGCVSLDLPLWQRPLGMWLKNTVGCRESPHFTSALLETAFCLHSLKSQIQKWEIQYYFLLLKQINKQTKTPLHLATLSTA